MLHGAGGIRVVPSQTMAQMEKRSPWHSDQSWDLMGGATPVPKDKMGRNSLLSVLPMWSPLLFKAALPNK